MDIIAEIAKHLAFLFSGMIVGAYLQHKTEFLTKLSNWLAKLYV
jgi:hypothetical protein